MNQEIATFIIERIEKGVYQTAIVNELIARGYTENEAISFLVEIKKNNPSFPISLTPLLSKLEPKRVLLVERRWYKYILMLGLALVMLSSASLLVSLFLNKLPTQSDIQASLTTQEPMQEQLDKKSFTQQYGNFIYTIQPIYSYSLQGVLVSSFEYGSFLNVFHKNDPGNVRDICLVWGKNITNNTYLQTKFHSEEFWCQWDNPYILGDNISNNHLLPATKAISNKILSAKKGDQVALSGYLVNYSEKYPTGEVTGSRNSSITRTDTGNGACEVMYVTDFTILKRSHTLGTILFAVSKVLLISNLLVLFAVTFIFPLALDMKKK